MQKKPILIVILLLFSVISSFSQEIQRITYTDIGADGSQRISRTVNAIFMGWLQQEVKLEGNLQAVYMCFRPHNGEWGDWELAERRPMQGSLNFIYNTLLRDYTVLPKNVGTIMILPGGNTALKMVSIPTGNTSPFWWSTSGNSFFIFHNLYLIVP
jgi:hypothetical protein